ncbi:MAG: HEPN domain-containing protein [Nitrososphaerales archaeon]
MKAIYQKLGGEVFGHSVSGLLSNLPENYEVGEELRSKAMELDKAYITTRYPNAIPEGTPFEIYTKEEVNIIC